MKILWLAPYPVELLSPELRVIGNKISHSASWIVNLSKELASISAIELHILTSSAHVTHSQSIQKNNINFHIIKYSFPFINRGFPNYFPWDSMTWYYFLVKRSLEFIYNINPDIIHAHGTEKGYSYIAYKSRLPYLISMQGIAKECFKTDHTLKMLVQIPIEKHCIRCSKYFASRTEWGNEFIYRYNPDAKIYYHPEAISYEYFNNKWKRQSNREIVYIGAVIKRKGIEILINALNLVTRRYPNTHLHVIGSGPQKYVTFIKKKVTNLNLDNSVIWRGQKSAKEISEILSNSEIFVLPTYIDNSPNSLSEALAVGIPSVASNVGGVPSIIKDGYNGLLLDVGNDIMIANKILELFEDDQLKQRLSQNAQRVTREKNYPPIIAKNTINIYKDILEKME